MFKKYSDPRARTIKEVDHTKSRTQPQFVSQTNIHSILKRSGLGEDMSFLARPIEFSGEEIIEHDYNDMSAKKYAMDMAFQENLNPYDRESFNNSPEEFYKYLADPKNEPEAIQRGFLVAKPPPAEPAQKPKGGTPPAGEGV